jgi:hypothetical protein
MAMLLTGGVHWWFMQDGLRSGSYRSLLGRTLNRAGLVWTGLSGLDWQMGMIVGLGSEDEEL